ncbi:MAG: DUF3798 domain-containing protein [Oscillospiraceae bacterium]|nr:DUF3798 domain-containing protein [Oscillospiraceae bacterium]
MFKKTCILMLVVLLVMTGCRAAAPAPAPADTPAPAVGQTADDLAEANEDWIIGIMTGTVSQNEEEFMAAMKMQERHGADRILHVTYPDRFSDEMETVIAQVVSLADQGAQAIIICQAVPGTIPAIQRVRERFPEILFVVGTIMEPPRDIAGAADVVLQLDDIGTGITIMEMAAQMGAETFVHYSFPRHLGIEMIALRRDNLMATAERLGIEFVDVMAPDPTGDAGLPGTQMFIMEDVPRQVADLGPNTVFYATNCGMQEPLIRGVLENGALYVQPCCPSPYHAFPAAMNISTAGHEGDVDFMLEQIRLSVAAADMAGRVSNWPVPVNMLIIEAGVDYAINWLEGNTNGRMDSTAVRASINRVAAEYGTTVNIRMMEDDQGTFENMFLLISENVVF